ncbi:MAG: zeta toxin family protein [Planctomycetota bacterium]
MGRATYESTCQRRSSVAAALTTLITLFLAVLLLGGCEKNSDEDSPPVNFKIASCSPGLNLKECEVEKRFADYLANNTDAAIWRYRQRFGSEINTDNARELSEDYAPKGVETDSVQARDARTRWSAAVQEPASLLSKELYRRMLAADTIVFTAGGAGSGKSSALKGLSPVEAVLSRAFAIYDTTLSAEDSSLARIEQAFKSGKKVYIIYVFRDPVASLELALGRAKSNGRTVPLKAFVEGHLGAPKVLATILKKYGNDARFNYRIIDNSFDEGMQKIVTDDIDKFFSGRAQTRVDLVPKLEQTLDAALKSGKISQEVYEASK